MSIVPQPIAPDTLALHGGQKPDPTTGSRAAPTYQTVSCVFEDGEHASSLSLRPGPAALELMAEIYREPGPPDLAAGAEERLRLDRRRQLPLFSS